VQRALLACVAGDGAGAAVADDRRRRFRRLPGDLPQHIALDADHRTEPDYPAVAQTGGRKILRGAGAYSPRNAPPAPGWTSTAGSSALSWPRFLRLFMPYLPNVAELEWSVSRALHAPEAPGIDLDRMARLRQRKREAVPGRAIPALSLIRATSRRTRSGMWCSRRGRLGSIQLEQGPVFLLKNAMIRTCAYNA